MLLIDRLRALQAVELDALSRPAPLLGATVPISSSLPPGVMGGLMIEQEIAALLHGAMTS